MVKKIKCQLNQPDPITFPPITFPHGKPYFSNIRVYHCRCIPFKEPEKVKNKEFNNLKPAVAVPSGSPRIRDLIMSLTRSNKYGGD